MMRGRDIRPGDVLSAPSGNWMVRDVDHDQNLVRLAAGRTDRGAWYELKPDGQYNIYRPEESR